MAIYQPYFYIIQDIRNGMYYAGAKWAQGCHPDQLLKEGGYPTSSETIKELIGQHGLDSFVIRKIKTFETGAEAHNYETRFLVKVDAKNHLRFYNGHNGDFLATFGTEKFESIMHERYGVKCYVETEKFKQEAKITKKERYGDENYNNKAKAKITKKERYGDENYNNRAKSKVTKKERYGDETYVNVDKRIETNNEKYGVSAPIQNPKCMDKLQRTNNEKYNVNFYVESDIFKEKRLATYKKKTSRKIVSEIKSLLLLHKISLYQGWYQGSDDKLKGILKELKRLILMKETGTAIDLESKNIGFRIKFR